MSGVMENIGRRLRLRRSDLGLSQEEVAIAAGLDRGQLSRIENGRIATKVEILIRLAKLLEVDSKWLFDF